MEERDLVAIIEGEISNSIGGGGDLADERALELDYYNSRPFGNEREGESQVISSDVYDVIEGMMPPLLKIFTASDDVVEFQPEGPEDEAAAQQRTDVCNYVFYRQNNGFVTLYEWFKTALLQKNGVVKYWWEEKTEVTESEYEGLTEGEYLTLVNDDDVEVLAHTAYEDEDAAAQRKQAIEQTIAKIPPGPNQPLQIQMLMQQMPPAPQLHDIKIKTTKDASKICIKSIPVEEFGISGRHTCITIQDAPFVYHRTKMTISDLRGMGCPENIIDELGTTDDGPDSKPEVLARNRFIDETAATDDSGEDDSRREVWVTDCFIRLDQDGDGIAELRHIIMPGRTVWINEPSDHINFAAITPIIMPNRFIGRSYAEAVMDIQLYKSVFLRQMFNNLYLTNNPQKVVLGSVGGQVQADLDRLMTSRVGGILVEYAPNAIRNQEVPFVAGASFPMLEYLEAMKENRTGVTRYNQGTDADSLNKTARGIQMIQTASQQKIDLVARIFAETGVKDLFRGIAYMLSKYSTKAMTVRLRNEWVDIDPRQWKTQFDMTVNVGLGTGNKDAQLVHLAKMNEVQLELIKTGRGHMVSDQNVYNLSKKMAENMGFKHPEVFITAPASPDNPDGAKAPPQQPNPDMLKIQQADSESKAKIQSNEKIRQFDAQTQKEIESIKQQGLQVIEQMRIASAHELEQMRLAHESQTTVFKENNAMNKHQMQLTDQTGGAERQLQDKATELQLREIELKRKEDAFNANTQIAALEEQHRQEMASINPSPDLGKHVDGVINTQVAEHKKKLDEHVVMIQDSRSEQMMKLMADSMKMLAQAVQEAKSVFANPPSKNIRIGDVQTDASGKIVSANISSTIQ